MSCKSTWIDHIEPRLVIVDGLSIRNQLLGDISLSHELGTALLRRWAQIDRESEIECPDISFKHVLQLDFSTLALAEGDIVNLLHIEKQFIGEDIPYPIESCQFIFALEEGWTVYMWDHACPGLSMFLTPVADHLDSIGESKGVHDVLLECLSSLAGQFRITNGELLSLALSTRTSRGRFYVSFPTMSQPPDPPPAFKVSY